MPRKWQLPAVMERPARAGQAMRAGWVRDVTEACQATACHFYGWLPKFCAQADPEIPASIASLKSFGVAVLFLVFPSVCNSSFSMLNCRTLTDDQPHLVLDLDVICWQGRHRQFSVIAGLFIAMYPLGVPIFVLGSQWRG